MVTKVSDTVVDTQCEGQFKYLPGESSGLNFVVTGGLFPEKEVVIVTPKTTFILIDNTTNFIVIDLDVTPGVVKVVTALPTLGILLFTIVTVSGSVTTVKDFRWRVVANRLIGQNQNTYESTLNAIGEEHYWKLLEESGTFADSGKTGGLTGTENTTNGLARKLPGAIRSTPFIHAVWRNTTVTNFIDCAAPVASHSQGTLGAFIRVTELGSDIRIMGQRYDSNDGIHAEFEVPSNGSIRMSIDQGTGNSNISLSNAAVITANTWHHIIAVQPGDGGGIELYVDGINQTMTQTVSGTGTLDDWFDTLASGRTPENFEIFRAGTSSGNFQSIVGMQFPFVSTTVAYTAGQVATLHSSANLTGDPVDYYETVDDTVTSPIMWIPFTFSASPMIDMGNGVVTTNDTHIAGDHDKDGGLETTNFSDKAIDFPASAGGLNDIPIADWPSTNDTTGTWLIWMKPEDITAGTRTLSWWGNGSFRYIRFTTNANQLEFQAQVGNGIGVYTQLVIGNNFSTGVWHQVAAVQNGTQLILYINGVAQTGGDITETTTGSGVDAGSWIDDIRLDGPLSDWRLGSRAGATSNYWEGQYGEFIYTATALSAADIAAIYAAR